MVGGSAFGFEDGGHRLRVERIGGQAVYGFGRQSKQFTARQYVYRQGNVRR